MESIESFLAYHAIEGGELTQAQARKFVLDCVADCEADGIVFFSDCASLQAAQTLPFYALTIRANVIAREWELNNAMQ